MIYVGNLVKIMHSEIEGNRLKTVGGDRVRVVFGTF